MKALQSLTDFIKSQVSEIKHFDVWAEDGAMFCGQGALIDGYELEYTAIIFIQQAKVQPDVLFMHLLIWLNTFDPERSEKGLAAPMFAFERLDKGLCDIKIKLDLLESYSLEEDESGEWKQGDIRYKCVNDFEAVADPDDLHELVYFVGHTEDLP